jgi:ketosteroid isomerase-like protein
VDSTGGALSAVRGRAAIQQLALAARQQAGGLTVQFGETEITVKDKVTATVRLVATARGGGLTEPFHRELQLTLRKTEGKWLVEKVEGVAALQRVD